MDTKFKRVQEEIETLKWHLKDDSLSESGKEKLEELEYLIDYAHSYTMFACRQQELLEFPEYIAKEHYVLANQIGKIHYWRNEENAKTTTQLYKDFKANDL